MQRSHLQEQFSQIVRQWQDEITQALIHRDKSIQLVDDHWQREDFQGEPGGGGITRAFTGDVIENAGVNTSEVYGQIDPAFASKLAGSGSELWASGLSLIIHPKNPRVPTVHANFRMIVQGDKYWFGGGADLTPYYPYEEDFSYFHHTWHQACDQVKKHYPQWGLSYEQMKKTCDEYFVNHHRIDSEKRAEMRGIGGLFFDHYSSGDMESDLLGVKMLGSSFMESYFPIVDKRYQEQWTEADEQFQLHRRGRYVEFNLLHDRGTLFGLKTNGRVPSILISLPARCNFSYKFHVEKNSVHEKMMSYYYPKDWLAKR